VTAVAYALLAVVARDAGDHATADHHIRAAQRQSRTTARRERQLVEIAALVVAGQSERADALSFEHRTDFPDDDDLLSALLGPRTPPAS
jgi:hypothetical protein